MSLFDHNKIGTALIGSSLADLEADYQRAMGKVVAEVKSSPAHPLTPETNLDPLRPQTFDDFMGQERIKTKLKKYIRAAMVNNKPLMHCFLAAKAGQGKTTLATIIANEMGVDVFWEGCPIHRERLLELSQEMSAGDVLMLDEVHLQARSRVAGASPEMLYHVLEQFQIITLNQGIIDFPQVTVIGATTDAGLLKDSFKERFPLKITFDDYSDEDMAAIAQLNARQLEVSIDDDAAYMLACASLAIPREVNNLMKQCGSLAEALGQPIDTDLAREVLQDEGREPDGLKKEMMDYLFGLWQRRRWSESKQEWVVKASLATMAHVVGRARDKAVVEHDIEPVLIKRGLIDIVPGGRVLTTRGMDRLDVKLPEGPQ